MSDASITAKGQPDQGSIPAQLGRWLADNHLVLLLAPDGEIVWASALAEAYFQGASLPLVGQRLFDCFSASNQGQALRHQIGRAMRQEGIWSGVVQASLPLALPPTLKATILPYSPEDQPAPDEDDRYVCLLFPATAADAAGSQSAEPAADGSTSSNRLLGVVEIDAQENIRSVSAPLLRMTGYTAADLVGQPLETLLPDWAANHPTDPHASLCRASSPGGTEVWLLVSYQAGLDAEGNPLRGHLYCFDLTAQQQHEAQLQELGRQLAQLNQQLEESQQEIESLNEELENSQIEFISHQAAITRSVCTMDFDLDGSILTANDNLLDLLGQELESLRGQGHASLLFEADAQRADYAAMWEGFAEGQPKIGSFRFRHADGYEIWLVGSYNAILNAEGEVQHVVMYAFDITLQKKTGTRPARSHRNAGRLGRRAAHEHGGNPDHQRGIGKPAPQR